VHFCSPKTALSVLQYYSKYSTTAVIWGIVLLGDYPSFLPSITLGLKKPTADSRPWNRDEHWAPHPTVAGLWQGIADWV